MVLLLIVSKYVLVYGIAMLLGIGQSQSLACVLLVVGSL